MENIIRWVIYFAAAGNENLVHILQLIEMRVFMLLPSISFFNGQISFFAIANKNAHCRKMPQYLLDLACETRNPCCSKNNFIINSFSHKFGFIALNLIVQISTVPRVNAKSILNTLETSTRSGI